MRAMRLSHAQRAERHALVELHAVAEHGGLADDDAGAMVDGERLADCAAGVDVDARLPVGELAQQARHQRHLAALQLMRQPVHGDGAEARVGEDDLVDECAAGSPS